MEARCNGRKALLVADDRDTGWLESALHQHGIDVRVFQSGDALMPDCEDEQHSIAILMLPDQATLIERMKQYCPKLRILAIGSHCPIETLQAALQSGADDFLMAPFSGDELVLRMRWISKKNGRHTATTLTYGDLTLDLVNRTANRAGREIPLSTREFELLRFLMTHPETILSRQRIHNEVWGMSASSASNVVDVYVNYLRNRTESDGGSRLLHTIRGKGYVLSREAPNVFQKR